MPGGEEERGGGVEGGGRFEWLVIRVEFAVSWVHVQDAVYAVGFGGQRDRSVAPVCQPQPGDDQVKLNMCASGGIAQGLWHTGLWHKGCYTEVQTVATQGLRQRSWCGTKAYRWQSRLSVRVPTVDASVMHHVGGNWQGVCKRVAVLLPLRRHGARLGGKRVRVVAAPRRGVLQRSTHPVCVGCGGCAWGVAALDRWSCKAFGYTWRGEAGMPAPVHVPEHVS